MEPYRLDESTRDIKPRIIRRITLEDRTMPGVNANTRKKSEIFSGNTHIPSVKKQNLTRKG